MEQGRWQQIDKIFQEAVALEKKNRDAFLDAACEDDSELRSEVISMLHALEEGDSLFERPFIKEHKLELGDRIGGYSVIKELGRGGMGVVFLAEQTEPIHRYVAIKLTTFQVIDQEVMKRFEIEQRLLARMNHSHVARLYESGIDGALPFFVMEYVDGQPITQYCDDNHLSIEARLSLFSKVCAGVSHAHLKGIIHRDIKPSNILVVEEDGEPIPKIIDFGIARCLDGNEELTRRGISPGTFRYMSPEQAGLTDATGNSLDLDPRTDVYSLGVLLYELLVGAPPLAWTEATPVMRICSEICSKVPQRPSQRYRNLSQERKQHLAEGRSKDIAALQRHLSGELDWIVGKTLEKDPDRRYRSPSDLVDELTRFKAGHPVLAGPPGLGYSLRKFVARQKMFVSAVASVILVVIAFLFALIAEQKKTARERDRAEEQLMRSRQLRDLIVDMFKTVDPFRENSGKQTLRDYMGKAAERIPESLDNQPLVRAELLHTIGQVQTHLGLVEPAKDLIEEGLTLRREHAGNSEELMTSLMHLGWLHLTVGESEAAIRHFREAVSLGPESLSAESQVELYSNLAMCLLIRQDHYDGKVWLEKGLKLVESHQIRPGVVTKLFHRIAILEVKKGDYEKAASFAKRSERLVKDAYGENSPSLLAPYQTLQDLYLLQGKTQEAHALACKQWNIAEATFNKDNLDYGYYLSLYGRSKVSAGHFIEALAISHEVITCYSSLTTKNPLLIWDERFLQAQILYFMDAYDASERVLQGVQKYWTENNTNREISLSFTYDLEGEIAMRRGQFEKAFELAKKAEPWYKSSPTSQAKGYITQGRIHSAMGNYSKAIDAYQKCHDILKDLAPNSLLAIPADFEFGLALVKEGRFAESKPLLDKTMTGYKQKYDLDAHRADFYFTNLVEGYRESNFLKEAGEAALYLIKLRKHQLGAEHPMTLEAEQILKDLQSAGLS